MSPGAAGKLAIALVLGAGVAVAYYGSAWWQSSAIPAPASVPAPEPVTTPVVIAPVPLKKVEKLGIDLDAKRIMLPGDGWISAQAFWTVYYTDPQRLPGDIDFDLLRQFEALTAEERAQAESLANAQAQGVGGEEPKVFDDPIPAANPVPPG